MRLRNLVLAASTMLLFAAPVRAQTITAESIDRFLAGRAAEKPELDKVGSQSKELQTKIKEWNKCWADLREIGQVVGMRPDGFKAKALARAKCGATSPDGWQEDLNKLYERPEEAGASAAKMDRSGYAQMKERVTAYLGGDRNFADGELKALNARAADLSNAMGLAIVKPGAAGRAGGGGGISGMIGNAIAAQVRLYTPDMTWAYMSYMNGLLYMSGATMFETDYKAGEWTQWTIEDSSRPDEHTTLERAMLRRNADKSELWRTKTITVGPEQADTIIMEQLMKPLDPQGTTMQIVRMRAKFPGDSAGKELMVPENMNTLSPQAFGRKPTAESVAGATVGTDNISAAGHSYSAKHVQYGSGTGTMDWWMSDKVPGGLVKVQSTTRGEEGKWTMTLSGTGTGAKSELGFK